MKRVKSTLLVVLSVMLVAVLSACGSAGLAPKDDKKIKVVTTIGQIGDAVKNIGGEHVDVISLMGPGVDPHLYKATQSDVSKLMNGDIIFYSGIHLEGKMGEVFAKIKKDKPTYAISESIPKDRLRKDPAGKPQMDPHVWFDIDLWKIAIEQVRDGLIEYDPDHEEDYRQNAESYFKKLDQLKQESVAKIQEIPKDQRVLVTAHDAFNYFGAAYDMEVMGLQGLSTDAEYGLGDVQSLVNVLVDRNIKAVFVESSISEKSINAVIEGAKKKGHAVEIGGELFSDAMGEEGTEEGTYIGMYTHNVDTIVNALK